MDRNGILRILLARAEWLHALVAKRFPKDLSRSLTAEDVVQEVWKAAFLNVDKFRSQDIRSLESWLVKTARTRIALELRHQKRLKRGGGRLIIRTGDQLRSSMVNLFGRLTSPIKSPSRVISDEETILAVKVALSSLPDEQRTAVRLRHLDGCTRSEIAVSMNKSDSQVKYLLQLGMSELRVQLGDAYRFLSNDSAPRPPEE